MNHILSPWLDKILLIPVYVVKSLGPLGQIKRSKFLNGARIEDRFERQSRGCRNLQDCKATMAARRVINRVWEGGYGSQGPVQWGTGCRDTVQ